jgi:hypothetical protein
MAVRNKAQTVMLTEKFDAYGEALPGVTRDEAAAPASAVLGRVGQYCFWLLVVVIVSARIIFYPAAPAFEVGSATQLNQADQAVTR